MKPSSWARGRGAAQMLLIAALGSQLPGCVCPGTPPRDRREALTRVNGNLAGMDRPLRCAAVVSFRFQDVEGRAHAFVGHDAVLLFGPPQSLRLDVRSLAGTVAQFGSNDREYWVWVDVPDTRKMWWGEWGSSREGSVRRLPVPPNELLDALMLRPLPESLDGQLLPCLRVVGDDHRLLYVRLGIDRQPSGLREVRLDTCPPYLPLEIIDRSPEGQVLMQATLGNYSRVGADGPFTPRRYVVTWPVNHAELRLDIVRATFRSAADLPPEVFDRPGDWRGEVERLDGSPDGSTELGPGS